MASATTNASGQYTLSVPQNATYDLRYTKSGYAGQTKSNVAVGSDTMMILAEVKLGKEIKFAGGNGTVVNPYQIATPQQLNDIRYVPNANFILLNDIDLFHWGNWGPIGQISSEPFSGIFNGNGFIVWNMTVDRASRAGLFGIINKGEVKNLGIVNATVYGYFYPVYAGGIAGHVTSSSITNCYFIGNITSYAINFNAYAGGISGSISSSSINNCYQIGNISANSSNGNAYTGGIVGNNNNSSISNCYYSDYNTINGIGNNVGGSASNMLALSDVQMKQQSSFVGFDFTNVWAIAPNVNNGYPYLRGMQP